MGNCCGTSSIPGRPPSSGPKHPAAITDLASGFPIVVIPFDKLKECGEIPRLGITQKQRVEKGLKPFEVFTTAEEKKSVVQPWQQLAMHLGNKDAFIPAKDFLVDIADVDSMKSFNVFISHRWIRGWVGAPGYDRRVHPDDNQSHKCKLIIEGVEEFWKAVAPGMTQCHVWLDFSCINQDGDPAGELRDLDKIVGWADAMFTPIVDLEDGSWAPPDRVTSWFKEYAAKDWNQDPENGYLFRSWCRVEMMFCALIPLRAESVSEKRLVGTRAGLLHALRSGRRYHVLFGTRESRLHMQPIALEPLQYSNFDEYDPEKGAMSVVADGAKITELVQGLQKYRKIAIVGYTGERDAEGAMHGRGTYTFANGEVYTGEYRNGLMEGQGTFLYSDGSVYSGEYKNDVIDGLGTSTYANGDVYTGEHRNDVKDGRGTYTYANGNTYTGEWKQSVKEGSGTYSYVNGDVYTGEFRADGMEGRGTFTWADGNTYRGDYKGNAMEGQGTLTWAEGDVYCGEFINDARHGRGVSTYVDGDTHSGDYKLNERDGPGVCTYANGSVYSGEYKNDVREGRGTFINPNGDVYTGEWKDGLKEGRGVCAYSDGRVSDCEYQRGTCSSEVFREQAT